jgi:hypothetical protein
MLHEFDRSKYFGASEGKNIFDGRPNTKSYREWWEMKCGLRDSIFHGNVFTRAGNTWEHSILRAYDGRVNFDRQIIHEDLRLRVNYDGDIIEEDGAIIVECKTHRSDKVFEVTDNYWYQAQLQMFAWNRCEYEPKLVDVQGRPKWKNPLPPIKKFVIISYALYPDELVSSYSDWMIEEGLLPADPKRIVVHEIKPSSRFQRKIPRKLSKLAKKLREEEING